MAEEYTQYQLPSVSEEEGLTNPGVLTALALGDITQNTSPTAGNVIATNLSQDTTNNPATVQTYIVTGAGIFSFGDASDGNVVITGNTTLTEDKYYKNLVVNASVTLNPGGYRIFVSEECIVNGTIARNGNDGSNASGQTGGAGGVALADGYLKGASAGGGGGTGGGSPTSGSAGANTSNSIGVNGVAGGNGGQHSEGGSPGSGGAGGTATASNVKLIANWHLNTLLDIGSTGAPVKFDNSASSGGGGGGDKSSLSTGFGGGGGGGATPGGVVAVYAKKLTIPKNGTISANGGDGGNGGQGGGVGGSGEHGGGGGGGAGSGGVIVLAYNQLSNKGTLSASGGTGGTGGLASDGPNGAAQDGFDGTDGSGGVIKQFQVSL